jgi:nicotinamide riboside transporter PnuC
MTAVIVFQWLGVALNLLGAIFVARKNASGFPIFILGNVALAAMSIILHLWGMVLLETIYAGINVYAIIEWKKKAKTGS